MPRIAAAISGSGQRRSVKDQKRAPSRFTVALTPDLIPQVEQYAAATNSSFSKAMAALVRLGLQRQEHRKREFFKALRENLANEDPTREDELVDEFRSLTLGR